MKNEDVKNEFQDLSTYINLGIKNYSEKQLSYPKCFNNKHYLAYDNDSIYLVDKLHLTFNTDYTSNCFNELNNYEINPENNYSLEEFISLKKAKSKRIDFSNNYLIVVSGLTYGHILYDHSKDAKRVQIELDNQFLYTNSSYDIIDNLYKITQQLKLTFNNISRYELARDSTTNLYNKYAEIYYQSDFCPSQVHTAHNSTPKYSNHGKNAYNPIVPNPTDNETGTAYIGNPKSAIQVKIYSKSNEVDYNKNWKGYITDIHLKHFRTADNITRVEVRLTSSIINKHKLDLYDLLDAHKHVMIFYEFVDKKLTFKVLPSKRWDKNNNRKYDMIKLLPYPEGVFWGYVKELKIDAKPLKIHNKNIDKFKIMVHSFLDDEINHFAVYGFIKTTFWDNHINFIDSSIITSRIYAKFQNPINCMVKKKQRFIGGLIESNGNLLKVGKAYWNYLF